jgi:cell division protein FtsZ
VSEVAEIVNAAADPEANIIFGALVDESLGDCLWVTVVAVGFDVTGEELPSEEVESGARPHQPADPEALRSGHSEIDDAEQRLEVPPFLS